MNAGDFEELKYPGHKPWLVIILLVAAAILVLQCYQHRRSKTEQPSAVPRNAVLKPAALPVERRAEHSTSLSAVVTPAKGTIPRSQPSAAALNQTLADAKTLEENGNPLKARAKYQELLRQDSIGALRPEVESRIGKIDIDLVTTPAAMPEKVDYIVKKGDSIDKIAKKFGTTVDLIQKSNGKADSHLIKAGDHLRVLTGKFALKVSKTKNDLLVLMNDEFFKRYSVGTGKFGKTPVGTFVIAERMKEPVWWRLDGAEVPYGDKENILGTRWMTLRATGTTPDVRGYGIHGCWDEGTIGKAESAGCVRMKNSDVEELFSLVPTGTTVVITE